MLCGLESLGEEGNTESEKKIAIDKEVQVKAEEKLEKIDLGIDPQKPRPISISLKLSEKEKAKLTLLLKESRDIFGWDYSEMSRLDPGLVVHALWILGLSQWPSLPRCFTPK